MTQLRPDSFLRLSGGTLIVAVSVAWSTSVTTLMRFLALSVRMFIACISPSDLDLVKVTGGLEPLEIAKKGIIYLH